MEYDIAIAQVHEMDTVLALVEALLAELGEEGQEFAQIDRVRLRDDLKRETASGRALALLARDRSGTAVGVLTLAVSFAIYAGGEYGVIDEMYVTPEHRSRGVGRSLVGAALGIAEERRWFRLDVTGPNAAGECADAGRADGTAGEARRGPAAAAADPAASGTAAGGDLADADPALRFYRHLGFEPTGQKLRLLIAGSPLEGSPE